MTESFASTSSDVVDGTTGGTEEEEVCSMVLYGLVVHGEELVEGGVIISDARRLNGVELLLICVMRYSGGG